MNTVHPNYSCHADELVPLALLLRVSAERDFAELRDLLPDDYDPNYLKRYDAAVAAADGLVASSVQRAKGMLVTEHTGAVRAVAHAARPAGRPRAPGRGPDRAREPLRH